MNIKDAISSSRTAIEVRQRCRKERFLGFHYEGKGLEKKASKYEAKFGAILHDAMKEKMIAAGRKLSLPGHQGYMDSLKAEIKSQFKDLPERALQHLINEQLALLDILVTEWCTRRLPGILQDFDILDVEVDREVVFAPEDYLPAQLAQILRPLKIMFRFDVVLRRKSDGLLFILDFKTASRVSEDWNTALDNSMQSYMYCEAARIIYVEPIGGIFYAGMVKGYREMSKARSCPYNGLTIQYGSFLYGWKDKVGNVHKDYVSGRQRQELWTGQKYRQIHNLESFFPITVPWKPIDIGRVIGQQIVAENGFKNDLELYEESGVHSTEKPLYENILFEMSLGNCFKYGTKHPCQFVNICHGMMHEDEIKQMYSPRVPHHKEEGE